MTLHGKVDDRVKQGMAWANKGGKRQALGRNQRFLESDPLVARQDRLSDANETVAVADRRRNVRYLVTAWFALFRRAS
jgi:hypothetical protein